MSVPLKQAPATFEITVARHPTGGFRITCPAWDFEACVASLDLPGALSRFAHDIQHRAEKTGWAESGPESEPERGGSMTQAKWLLKVAELKLDEIPEDRRTGRDEAIRSIGTAVRILLTLAQRNLKRGGS